MTEKTNNQKHNYRTIHFVSLGCPKNRVDTEVMAGAVTRDGMRIVADPSDADVIVVNTCAFVGDAREESIDTLLEMATYRASGTCRLLVATGCLPQRSPNELSLAMPEIDRLMGTRRPDQISELLKDATFEETITGAGHFLQNPTTPRFLQPGTPSAYVKIGDGCSRKCAFCAIPGIRGKAGSRPLKQVVAEVEQLVSNGVKEFNLVAQDTAAYGVDLGDGTNLAALVRALDQIPGVSWIRLLYLYPDAVTDDLLHAIANSQSVVPYLDIPIQHASFQMLKRMRRGHGPDVLENVITRARRILPDSVLRTTVLVGHPGETQEDMDYLLDFIARVGFDHLGVFRYSDEEGTPSFGTEPRVSKRDAYNRWRKVMATQRRISKARLDSMVGRTAEVLIEDTVDDAGFVLQGRHRGQAPDIDGVTYVVSCRAKIGDIVPVRIIEAKVPDLVAEPLDEDT